MDDPVIRELIRVLVRGLEFAESQMEYDTEHGVDIERAGYQVYIPYISACAILGKLEQ